MAARRGLTFKATISGTRQVQHLLKSMEFASYEKEFFRKAENSSRDYLHKHLPIGETRELRTNFSIDFPKRPATANTPGRYEMRIRSHAPHAIYLEEGTQPHRIRPRNKKALSWVEPGQFRVQQVRRVRNGREQSAGVRITRHPVEETSRVIVPEVMHPGIEATAPFATTGRAMRPRMRELLVQQMNRQKREARARSKAKR